MHSTLPLPFAIRPASHAVVPSRILVLHPFRTCSEILARRLSKMRKYLKGIAEFVFIDSPHTYRSLKSTANGLPKTALHQEELSQEELVLLGDTPRQRCWWDAISIENSDLKEYVGFDESIEHLKKVFQTQGPFDGILGFSQGGTLAGALASLQPLEDIQFRFAICISSSAARSRQRPLLMTSQGIDIPSLHFIGTEDLYVDNSRSQVLADCFVNAEVVLHSGGHFSPNQLPLGALKEFLLKQALPLEHTSAWDQRVWASILLSLPQGISPKGVSLWRGAPREQLLDASKVTSSIEQLPKEQQIALIDDLLLIGWAHYRAPKYQRIVEITATLPGDLFYWLWISAYLSNPKHTISRLADIPRHGRWRLLSRLYLLSFAKPPIQMASEEVWHEAMHRSCLKIDFCDLGEEPSARAETLVDLREAILDLLAKQLRADLAAVEVGETPSTCAHSAPRLDNATDQYCQLAHLLAEKLHPCAEGCPAWHSKRDYRHTLATLTGYLRSLIPPPRPPRPSRHNASQNWSEEALAAPISQRIINPEPEPVVPCSMSALAPLLLFLDAKDPVREQMNFPKGTMMPDGRLDLCKQVVGPLGIGPLLHSMNDNPHVECLMIGNNIVSNTGAEEIAAFIASGHSKVKVWYIAGNQFDARGIALICAAIAGDPQVESLWLKRNPLKPASGPPIAELLRKHPTIHTLDVVNTGLLDEGIQSILGGLEHNTVLRHLYIGTNGVTAVGAASMGEHLVDSRLESLFATCNRIGDEGARLIADGLLRNKNLKRLGLSSNRIGPAGAVALAAALRNHPSLEHLDLGWNRATSSVGELGNRIGDEGALALAELLKHNKVLRSLDLSHNNISAKGVAALAEALTQNDTLVEFELPQHGRSEAGDSLERLKIKVQQNKALLLENSSGEEVLRTLRTPLPAQEILSVYRMQK